MNSTQANPERDFVLLKFLLHIVFFATGTSTVIVGQILPILFNRLDLTDERAAYFFVAQFSGSVAGTLISSPLVKRIGFIRVLLSGLALTSLGILALNSDSYAVCLTATLVHGVGIGFSIPAVNMQIAELSPRNTSAALSFLNFFWGVGAILCKPFVDFFGSPASFFAPALILVFWLAATGLAIFFAPRPDEGFGFREAFVAPDSEEIPIWKRSNAWLMALFNFLYVGLESGLGGWITTFETRLSQPGGRNWLSAAFAFFLFLVAGRALAAYFLRFLSENVFLLISLGVLAAGVGISVGAQYLQTLLYGAAIAGFGAAAVFPTNVARFTKFFGAGATRQTTPLFVAGSLGGGVVTWFVGYVSTSRSDLRAGMLVLLAAALALLALQIVLTFRSKKL